VLRFVAIAAAAFARFTVPLAAIIGDDAAGEDEEDDDDDDEEEEEEDDEERKTSAAPGGREGWAREKMVEAETMRVRQILLMVPKSATFGWC